MKKVIIVLLLISFITIIADPIFNQQELAKIKESAENSATQETSKFIWFFAGFVLNGLAILGGYVYEPNPPVSQIIGKDYNYVRVYTDYYVRKAKKLQVKYATWGCVSSTLIYVIIYGITLYWYVDSISSIAQE